MKFKPFKKFFNKKEIVEPTKEQKKNIETKKLEEIIRFSQNPDVLKDCLNLYKIESIKTKESITEKGDTFFINSSGVVLFIERNVKNAIGDEEYMKYPLVDFGSNASESIIKIAQKLKTSGVVLSDLKEHLSEDQMNSSVVVFNGEKIESSKNKDFPILDLDIDMLELITQLPDNSSNLSLFAIDNIIIPKLLYQIIFFKNIIRVIPSGGILLMSQSFVLEEFKNELETYFERVDKITWKKK